MWRRLENWRASTPVENSIIFEEIRSEGKTAGIVSVEYAFQCSHLYCQQYEKLKETPSGIWCRRHYLSLPGCAICGEPVIVDLIWFKNNVYCRNHADMGGERESEC